MGKMMMLVAAKWREFMSQNPNAEQQEEEEAPEEQEYAPKPSRTRAAKVSGNYSTFSYVVRLPIL